MNNEQPDLRRWMTIAESAQYLGVVPLTIRRQISRGRLKAYRIKGVRAIRIDRREVDALLVEIPVGELDA